MSIVGPRPERPYFYGVFEKTIHGFSHRLNVTPGLTGLAQVNGGYDLLPEEKIVLDMQYIQNRSLWLDTKCILKTFLIIFNHMKVLIITPFFFDYHKRIKRTLEEKGAEVTLIDERPNKSTLTKIFLRKDFKFYRRKRDQYFWNLLTLKDDFDYILYVKCESPTENALHFLKEHFSKAKHILYLWDSVKNVKNIEAKFKYFDEIYSFDNDDVSKYPFMTYAYWGYSCTVYRTDRQGTVTIRMDE